MDDYGIPRDIQLPPGLPQDVEATIRTDYHKLRQQMVTLQVQAEDSVVMAQRQEKRARERAATATAEAEAAKTRENAARTDAEEARAREAVARAEATDTKGKQAAAEDSARAANQGIVAMRKEAEAVKIQLADFMDAMEAARREVEATRAEVNAVQVESMEAIRIARATAKYWKNVARENAAEAEVAVFSAREGERAARDEVEALKSELEGVNSRVAEANEVKADEEFSEVQEPEGEIEESSEETEPEEPIGGFDAKEEIMEPAEPEVPRSSAPDAPVSAPPSPASSYLYRNLFPTTASNKRLWPNGQVITYRFVDGHTNQHAKVTRTIPEWSRYANITFRRASGDTPTLLAISFKDTWECWSCIGTDVQTLQPGGYTMALGPVSVSPDTTHGDRAVILHQFGHVLGLGNEYICPTQTDAVSLKQDLIFEHPSFGGLDPSVRERFGAYAKSSLTNYASPDLSSIMVFSMPGKLNEGLTIVPNLGLSALDKAFMVINYPRARVHSQASEWTLCHALAISGIDEHTSRVITKERHLSKRRVLFANHLSATRARRKDSPADPDPKIVNNLRHPAVRNALHTFLTDPVRHHTAKEILEDKALRQELVAVLVRLGRHHAIREIVRRERGKATYQPPDASNPARTGPALMSSMLNTVLMLHTSVRRGPASPKHADHTRTKQAESDSMTDLCVRLARHPVFRVAMERAVGAGRDTSRDAEVVPDVSVLVARLAERPAVLRAVRLALVGHVR